MLSLSDIRTSISLAKDVVQYLMKRQKDETTTEVLNSLKTIYFDATTVSMMESLIEANAEDRDQLARKLSRRLLDVRYSVHRSLIDLENEGFRESLGLRAKRLFDEISRGKVDVRNSLIVHLSSSGAETSNMKELLSEVRSLNEMIEALDDIVRSTVRKS